MIPARRKVNRILFERLLKQSRVYHSPHLSFRVNIFASNQPARFSVVVSKKIDPRAKSAVWRNTMKRRAYTMVRSVIPRVTLGCVGVFFLKKGFHAVSVSTIKLEIDEMLKAAKVIAGDPLRVA